MNGKIPSNLLPLIYSAIAADLCSPMMTPMMTLTEMFKKAGAAARQASVHWYVEPICRIKTERAWDEFFERVNAQISRGRRL